MPAPLVDAPHGALATLVADAETHTKHPQEQWRRAKKLVKKLDEEQAAYDLDTAWAQILQKNVPGSGPYKSLHLGPKPALNCMQD